MSKYKDKNGGYSWILTAVELLSRYAFTIAVFRKDTNNMTKSVAEFLRQFKSHFSSYPRFVQFDDGKELYNVGTFLQLFLQDTSFYNFSTFSDKKAGVVERLKKINKKTLKPPPPPKNLSVEVLLQ